jgi:hypothetical protein
MIRLSLRKGNSSVSTIIGGGDPAAEAAPERAPFLFADRRVSTMEQRAKLR